MSCRKWDCCIQGQGHNKGSKCQWMFVQIIFSESQNILLPNLIWWCNFMSQSHVDILLLLLSSRPRSQQWLIWWKYGSFYNIIWTVDSLATKLGLMIHHQKPECPMTKIGYCIQGQGHSEGQNLMFVQMMSSKPSNILFSNLVFWFFIMSQSAKRLICYFQGQVYCKSSYNQNMTISTVSFELLILLLPNLVW